MVLAPEVLKTQPGDYYGKTSGVGQLMDARDATPSRVGVIGLGAGVMAAYAREGDHFTFFEINPQSAEVAHAQFSYLANAKGRVDLTPGDARIELQKQLAAGQGSSFDALVVDAFSGDAIPVHLLTKEAFTLYLSHLRPDGVLAIHISNKYLDLRTVVSALAESLGAQALAFSSKATEGHEFSSIWVVLVRDGNVHRARAWYSEDQLLPKPPGDSHRYLWTDLNNNLFDVLLLGR
jgi:spermidine synthase